MSGLTAKRRVRKETKSLLGSVAIEIKITPRMVVPDETRIIGFSLSPAKWGEDTKCGTKSKVMWVEKKRANAAKQSNSKNNVDL